MGAITHSCPLIAIHYNDVKMSAMASQITSLTVVYATVYSRRRSKKDITAPRHWPLCREFTSNRWNPRTKGQWRGKCFHLMTSSWYWWISKSSDPFTPGGLLTMFGVMGRLGPFDPPFSTYVEFWPLLLGVICRILTPFFKHCRILTPIFHPCRILTHIFINF